MSRTAAAVRNFQRGAGIAVTGDVGPQTRGALSSRSSDFVGAGNTYKPDNRAQVSERPLTTSDFHEAEAAMEAVWNNPQMFGTGVFRSNTTVGNPVEYPQSISFRPISSTTHTVRQPSNFSWNVGDGAMNAAVNIGPFYASRGVSWNDGITQTLSAGWGNHGITHNQGIGSDGNLIFDWMGTNSANHPVGSTSVGTGYRLSIDPAFAMATSVAVDGLTSQMHMPAPMKKKQPIGPFYPQPEF